jgi:periplasmic divalent cation tolerance protein
MKSRSRPDVRLVLVTVPDQDAARAIARAVVGDKLAACVNIVGPIRSIYRWQDAIEDEAEFLLLIKTRARLYARVEARVKELHSYQVPEVIALPIESGSGQYLGWLLEATAPTPTRKRPRPRARKT